MQKTVRIDGLDLDFYDDDDLFSLVSEYRDIDLVIQPLPLDKAFSAEVVNGKRLRRLGAYPSERWAIKAALDAAKKAATRAAKRTRKAA